MKLFRGSLDLPGLWGDVAVSAVAIVLCVLASLLSAHLWGTWA